MLLSLRRSFLGFIALIMMIYITGCGVQQDATDLCRNVDGVQSSVPGGYVANSDGTCSQTGTNEPGGGVSESPTVTDPPSSETPVPDNTDTATPDPVCTDLEVCYNRTQMVAFYSEAIKLVEEYANTAYTEPPLPKWNYIEYGDTGDSACKEVNDRTYAYCYGDDTVYVGLDRLWGFYGGTAGDAGAIFGIAHEWGHHLQDISKIYDVYESNQASTIQAENQADCIAGAAFGYWIDKGYVINNDIANLEATIEQIASSEDDPKRDHGTIKERANAAALGIKNGIGSCNDFFPDAPIIVYN